MVKPKKIVQGTKEITARQWGQAILASNIGVVTPSTEELYEIINSPSLCHNFDMAAQDDKAIVFDAHDQTPLIEIALLPKTRRFNNKPLCLKSLRESLEFEQYYAPDDMTMVSDALSLMHNQMPTDKDKTPEVDCL
jgi:hypothetical protein